MASALEQAESAIAAQNRRLQRWHVRGVIAVACLAIGLAIATTVLFVGYVTAGSVYAFRGWFISAALVFAGVALGGFFAGSQLVRWLLARAQRRGIERIARDCRVSAEELAELAPPVGDSATIMKRKIGVRWSSPKDRNPLRWP